MKNYFPKIISKYKWHVPDFFTPLIFSGAFFLIFIVLLYVFFHNSAVGKIKEVQFSAEHIGKNIELKLKGNLDYLKLIAIERADKNITEQMFESHVNHFLKDHPEFINITWVDSNFVIKTVSPTAGNSHIIGFRIELSEPKRASHQAKDTKKSVYTKPFEAIQGKPSFEVWVPVFKGKTFLGLFAGVYSCSNLLNISRPLDKQNGIQFNLIDENNIVLAGSSKSAFAEKSPSFQYPLKSFGNGMKVTANFVEEQPFSRITSFLFITSILLFTGLVFSLWKIKSETHKGHKILDALMDSNERIKKVNEDLVLAKKKSEESEETYRMLFDSINDAVFLSEYDEYSGTIRFIKVNDVACQKLGYSRDELLTLTPSDLNSKQFQPNIPNFIKRILEGKQAFIETEHVTKDGRIIPVEISTKVTEFKNKIIFHSIVRDITERKINEQRIKEKTNEIEAQNEEYLQINEELFAAKDRAEESEIRLKQKNEELKNTINRLTDLESRLQFALLAGNLGTWDWNIKKGELIWSDSCKLMCGLTLHSEVNYERFINTIVSEDRELTNKLVVEALNEKKDYNHEYRVLWPDDTLHWISVMGRGIYDSSGEAIRMIGVAMEITERKNIELSLSHSHDLMRYIIEHNPCSIAVFDNELKYIYVSQQYLKAYQVKESSILGKNHHEIFTDLPQKYKDAHFKALKGEIVREEEDSYYREDGSVNWTSWECRPWYQADGAIGGIILYIEQITDRIQQKMELIAAKEKAEESDRLKTAFLQNMSHEIRTPMNAIMGFSGLMKDELHNKTKIKQFAEIINQRSSDLLDIINDVLDIAKIESGQLSVNPESCNLFELFNELYLFFTEYQTKLGKEQLSFSLQPQINQTESYIIIDKVKLKQILINLLTNAFKFTDQGKIEGGCFFDHNHRLVFYVSDTGIGIPMDKQKAVFERFVQIDNSSRKVIRGTGLGLSIVRGLVKLLGGEITLESQPGKGSTFKFSILYDVK